MWWMQEAKTGINLKCQIFNNVAIVTDSGIKSFLRLKIHKRYSQTRALLLFNKHSKHHFVCFWMRSFLMVICLVHSIMIAIFSLSPGNSNYICTAHPLFTSSVMHDIIKTWPLFIHTELTILSSYALSQFYHLKGIFPLLMSLAFILLTDLCNA